MSSLKSSKAQAAAAPALRELLSGFLDYAGLFPPAKLPLDEAIRNCRAYRDGEHAWLLRRFVVPLADLAKVPSDFNIPLAVLTGETPGAAAAQDRADALEVTAVPGSARTDAKPVYCQVASDRLELLDAVKKAGCYAKIRTGGLTPAEFPAPSAVAQFIINCADRKLPFKATAGLHHPLRASYRLTYEPGCEQSVMHGFVNVLMAAAFAWHGERHLEPILEETDADAFSFDDSAKWRDLALSKEQVHQARHSFIHSVGSCSFEEPVRDLKQLGWL